MKKGHKTVLVTILTFIFIGGIAVLLLIRHANKILKYELENILGKDFSVKEIKLSWGEVNASDIRFRNLYGREIFKADNLIVDADFKGLLKREYILSNLSLINPYLFIETDKKGNIISYFPQKEKKAAEKPFPPFLIKKTKIINGSLDYLDGKVIRTPVLTKVRDIALESKEIVFPPDERFSAYSLTASISGTKSTGTVKSSGKIKLLTRDMDSVITVKNLDITDFKPYFQKKGDVNVIKGFLDLDMNVKLSSRKIHAPGRATLRDIQFETGHGMGNKFLSLPLSALVSFMKTNDQISFDFLLEGDLNNPKFNLRENLIEKITIGLAGKLGLSVTRIGESIVVLGAEGVKQVGKGLKDVGQSIRDIFK